MAQDDPCQRRASSERRIPVVGRIFSRVSLALSQTTESENSNHAKLSGVHFDDNRILGDVCPHGSCHDWDSKVVAADLRPGVRGVFLYRRYHNRGDDCQGNEPAAVGRER